MGGIGADGLLTLVEQGQTADKLTRLRLLAAAFQSEAEVDQLPLGDIDRVIWRGFQKQIAPRSSIDLVCNCPHCDEQLEFSLDSSLDGIPATPSTEARVQYNGQTYHLRRPKLSDIRRDGVDYHALSEDAPWDDSTFRDKAQLALAEADPMLAVVFSFECPACSETFEYSLDVGALLWDEVQQQGRWIVDDVIRLSTRLGWSEQEILAMSQSRRNLYLAEVDR